MRAGAECGQQPVRSSRAGVCRHGAGPHARQAGESNQPHHSRVARATPLSTRSRAHVHAGHPQHMSVGASCSTARFCSSLLHGSRTGNTLVLCRCLRLSCGATPPLPSPMALHGDGAFGQSRCDRQFRLHLQCSNELLPETRAVARCALWAVLFLSDQTASITPVPPNALPLLLPLPPLLLLLLCRGRSSTWCRCS